MPEIDARVAAFTTYEEAYLARNLLSAEGIEAFVQDEHLHTIYFHLQAALGGVKLLVPEQDAEHAISILGEVFQQAGRHEKVVVTDEKKARFAYRAALFSLVFPTIGALFLVHYSTWMVIGLMRSGIPLSPIGRKRLIRASLIDFVFLCVLSLMVYFFITGG